MARKPNDINLSFLSWAKQRRVIIPDEIKSLEFLEMKLFFKNNDNALTVVEGEMKD